MHRVVGCTVLCVLIGCLQFGMVGCHPSRLQLHKLSLLKLPERLLLIELVLVALIAVILVIIVTVIVVVLVLVVVHRSAVVAFFVIYQLTMLLLLLKFLKLSSMQFPFLLNSDKAHQLVSILVSRTLIRLTVLCHFIQLSLFITHDFEFRFVLFLKRKFEN